LAKIYGRGPEPDSEEGVTREERSEPEPEPEAAKAAAIGVVDVAPDKWLPNGGEGNKRSESEKALNPSIWTLDKSPAQLNQNAV